MILQVDPNEGFTILLLILIAGFFWGMGNAFARGLLDFLSRHRASFALRRPEKGEARPR